MKRKVVLYSLLMASTAVFMKCSDPDPAKKSCFPTELPAEEGIMKLRYNASNLVTDIDFINDDEPDAQYTMTLEYDDEKISKVNYYDGEFLESYSAFTYHSDITIIQHEFWNNGGPDFREEERYIYYLEDDRIIACTSYFYWDNVFQRADSTTYTYNSSGNVTVVSEYNADGDLFTTTKLTYDDKINPYKISGLPYTDNEFFTPYNMSSNNITSFTYIDGGESDEEETITLTYDGAGKPVTQRGSWQGETYDIRWTCP